MPQFRDLKFLETPSGQIPFFEWYDSLKDRRARRIITDKLRLLQNAEFEGYKSVGHGIFELRIFYGPGFRIYFAFENEQVVVAVGGGDKSSQRADIDRAVSLWSRHKNAS